MKKRFLKKIQVTVLCLSMVFSSVSYGDESNLATDGEAETITDLRTENKAETLEGGEFTGEVGKTFKATYNNNPLSSEIFCADPTSVEYNGRLYVYGTCDHEQYEAKGKDMDNTYEKIKSFVVFSTEDMVNWTYHGRIDTDAVAPWITNSWAPSIVSRVEEDGKTHFYLYFSNNGTGVGVITATNPLGPWSDPLGKPLVSTDTEGLKDCPNPFDPGAVIDDNGVGYLSFGGSGNSAEFEDRISKASKIVRLGSDMISLDSEIATIPAPYFFEASELNYINGTYVYTYCSDWSDHSEVWDYDCAVPGGCSMIYMTSKTPLDTASWQMKGEILKNPGEMGFDYGNNHTHMQKYKGKWFMLYHSQSLKSAWGFKGGYRSLCVDEIDFDEESVSVVKSVGTQKGTTQIESVNPYVANSGNMLCASSGMGWNEEDLSLVSNTAGAYMSVKGVEFTEKLNDEEDSSDAQEDTEKLEEIKSIEYKFNVVSVSADTTITMHAEGENSGDKTGEVLVTKTGDYSIKIDFDNESHMMNMGYFRASDDAKVTFNLESIIVNDKYEFAINSELTNTRDWADGLRNIWNFMSVTSDTDVYTSEYATIRYVVEDQFIELFKLPGASANDSAVKRDDLVFLANVIGKGRVEVRLDKTDGNILTSLDFDNDEYVTIYNKEVAEIGGTHNLYFVFSGSDISIKNWQFADKNDFGEELKYIKETKETDEQNKTDGNEDANQADKDSFDNGNGKEGSTSDKTSANESSKVKIKRVKIKKAFSPKKRTLKIKWKKVKGVKGYQIIVATNKKFTKNKKKIFVKKNKATKVIKKLKSGKKYFVKVRAYKIVNGKKKFGKWSKRKKVKVK